MSKEITIKTDEGLVYYGNTTNNSIDFDHYEWIKGVLHIHLKDGNVHVYNLGNKEISYIKTCYEGQEHGKMKKRG